MNETQGKVVWEKGHGSCCFPRPWWWCWWGLRPDQPRGCSLGPVIPPEGHGVYPGMRGSGAKTGSGGELGPFEQPEGAAVHAQGRSEAWRGVQRPR